MERDVEVEQYHLDSRFVRELDYAIESMLDRGTGTYDEAEFNRIALLEFEFQYHANTYYRDYCTSLARTPQNVNDWRQIPPVPSRAFKDNLVVSFPTEQAELFFMTSGTTDPAAKGQIYRDKRGAGLHYKANILATRTYLFPDVERMRVLLMVPSPEIAPHMGMAIGLHIMKDEFGTEDSAYLITKQGLNVSLLISALREAEQTGRPLALVGATSGFVVLYRQFAAMGLRFKLPAGSRIADGGGYSGIFGDCSQNELLRLTKEYLDILPEYVVNTLGTAESATNYIDHTLYTAWLGLPQRPRCKALLPWTKVVAMDKDTFQPLPNGETGLLCLYDLVNRSTALAVQTDNLGYTTEDGFEIMGRAGGLTQEGAPMREHPTVVTDLLRHSNGLPKGHPPMGHPANIPMGHPPINGMPAGHPPIGRHGQVCSTVADELLKAAHPGEVCSTVADNFLLNGRKKRDPRQTI